MALSIPCPVHCIFDAGSEFKAEFRELLHLWDISPHQISIKNPQANSVAERCHQTVATLIRSLIHDHPPQNIDEANALIDHILATVQHALRATIHRGLGLSPGTAIFHQDMLLDIPIMVDYVRLQGKRQRLIDNNLRRENNKRRAYDYVVGGQVYEIRKKLNTFTGKLQEQTTGPYPIVQVHTTGTLTIRRNPTLLDRVNIRHLRPVL